MADELKWLPIDTAPQDGTSFIVGQFVHIDPDDGEMYAERGNGRRILLGGIPKHWMPVPKTADHPA